MQTLNARMRRAVEEENQDVNAKFGASTSGAKPTTTRRRRQTHRRKPLNVLLLLIVLSPLAIIGCLVYSMNRYALWKAADADTENLLPGNSGAAADHRADGSEGGVGSNQLKRLRKKKKKQERGEADAAAIGRKAKESDHRREHKFLVLTTKHGNIKITLRPDLSEGSVDYIHRLVESYGGNGKRCMHCNFYRSEKPGILQGIMENKDVVPVNTVRGSCPEGSEGVPNECPEWDAHCGCHGPVMKRGAVAWAAGEAGGPDFFIDGYPNPADWWGTQHTNFGFIDDEASMEVVDAIFELPVETEEDMDFLKDPIHFDLVLE